MRFHRVDREMQQVGDLFVRFSFSHKLQDFGARFAAAYSTIYATLNDLAAKNSVRSTNLSYSPVRAPEGLVELRLDASLSGEYAPLMHFINDLERDKNHVFFIVDGLTFTGQQGGLVNLRLKLTTYLRTNPGDQPPANQGEDTAGPEPVSEEGPR